MRCIHYWDDIFVLQSLSCDFSDLFEAHYISLISKWGYLGLWGYLGVVQFICYNCNVDLGVHTAVITNKLNHTQIDPQTQIAPLRNYGNVMRFKQRRKITTKTLKDKRIIPIMNTTHYYFYICLSYGPQLIRFLRGGGSEDYFFLTFMVLLDTKARAEG